jgi:hypothetical protein
VSRGPRPACSAGLQATEKCDGVWVRVRHCVIYHTQKKMKTGKGKQTVFAAPKKALGALHPLLLDKLRAQLVRGPARGHSLLAPWLKASAILVYRDFM